MTPGVPPTKMQLLNCKPALTAMLRHTADTACTSICLHSVGHIHSQAGCAAYPSTMYCRMRSIRYAYRQAILAFSCLQCLTILHQPAATAALFRSFSVGQLACSPGISC